MKNDEDSTSDAAAKDNEIEEREIDIDETNPSTTLV
jgi:hypothetical protein